MKDTIVKKHFLWISVVVLLGACAATVPITPSDADMKMKSMQAPPDKALVYVYRSAIFAGSAVIRDVFIDGISAGKLAEKTYMALLLDPGKHRLQTHAAHDPDRTLSPHFLPINAIAGSTYFVDIGVLNVAKIGVLVSADEARKAIRSYKLIYESEEPIIVSALRNGAPSPTSIPAEGTVPSVRADVDELPLPLGGDRKDGYAIVIGIDSYRQKLPKADFADADARIMSDYLTKVLGYPEENVVILSNERASLGDFVKYFEKWLPNNVGKGSTVFVYYSGHGAPDPRTGGAYLVPYDGDPAFIAETGYSLKRMYEALGKLPAKEIIVALDSCFSGAGGRSVIAKGARPLVMNLQTTIAPAKNMTVLAASSGEQISSTYDEKGHGLFTYFMLKGIRNEDVVRKDGSLDIQALFNYVRPQVESIARKKYNNEQAPQLIEGKR